jgi:hypothetical protein
MSCADAQALSELRVWLRDAGADQPTVERAIERAADEMGISYSRAFSMWYGRAKTVLRHEYETMKGRRRVVLIQKLARLETARAEVMAELDALDPASPTQRAHQSLDLASQAVTR